MPIPSTGYNIEDTLGSIVDPFQVINSLETIIRKDVILNTESSSAYNIIMDTLADQLQEAARSSAIERAEQLKTIDYIKVGIEEQLADKKEREKAMAAYDQAVVALQHATTGFEKISDTFVKNIGNVTGVMSTIFTDMPPIFGMLSTRLGDFVSKRMIEKKTKQERLTKMKAEIGKDVFKREIDEKKQEETDLLKQEHTAEKERIKQEQTAEKEKNKKIKKVKKTDDDTNRKVPRKVKKKKQKLERIKEDTVVNVVASPEQTYQSVKEQRESTPSQSKFENVPVVPKTGPKGGKLSLIGELANIGKTIVSSITKAFAAVPAMLKAMLIIPVVSGLLYAYEKFKEPVSQFFDSVGEKFTALKDGFMKYFIEPYVNAFKFIVGSIAKIKDLYMEYIVSPMIDALTKVKDVFSEYVIDPLLKGINFFKDGIIKMLRNIPIIGSKFKDMKTSDEIEAEQTTRKEKFEFEKRQAENLAAYRYTEEDNQRANYERERKIARGEQLTPEEQQAHYAYNRGKEIAGQSKTLERTKDASGYAANANTISQQVAADNQAANNTNVKANVSPITNVTNVTNNTTNNSTSKNVRITDPLGAIAVGGFR